MAETLGFDLKDRVVMVTGAGRSSLRKSPAR